MCYIKGSDLHYSNFPYLNNDLLIGNYENKFECENGYQLVNYHLSDLFHFHDASPPFATNLVLIGSLWPARRIASLA